MATLLRLLEVWFALNVVIPAFIAYQRSPSLRHRLFRFTFGWASEPKERWSAHVLVDAARHSR